MNFRDILSVVVALFPVCCTQASAQSIRRLDGSKLSYTQAAAIADEELLRDNVMGAQIAILNHGCTVWTHGYGLRNAADKLPMTSATNTWAASITKSVFATWVMQQVEQGRLDLDKPIASELAKPLTEYEDYRESAVEIVKDPRWKLVTPRMLLSHTSGLSNFAAFLPDKKMHLFFTPGARFAYSGEGINLVQLLVEEKTGEKLDVAMQRDIFGPLGMKTTGMVWREEFADGALRYDAKGRLLGATRRLRPRAAGNMASSAEDLARFTEALLAGKLLKAETQKEMLSAQVVIHTAHEFPTLDTATGDEGRRVGLSYGLGWGLLTKTRFGPAIFKEGHGDGAENYLICFPRSGSCMILLTNSDNGELAFRPLLEKLLGDTVTPWEWEGYTHESVLKNEEHSGK